MDTLLCHGRGCNKGKAKEGNGSGQVFIVNAPTTILKSVRGNGRDVFKGNTMYLPNQTVPRRDRKDLREALDAAKEIAKSTGGTVKVLVADPEAAKNLLEGSSKGVEGSNMTAGSNSWEPPVAAKYLTGPEAQGKWRGFDSLEEAKSAGEANPVPNEVRAINTFISPRQGHQFWLWAGQEGVARPDLDAGQVNFIKLRAKVAEAKQAVQTEDARPPSDPRGGQSGGRGGYYQPPPIYNPQGVPSPHNPMLYLLKQQEEEQAEHQEQEAPQQKTDPPQTETEEQALAPPLPNPTQTPELVQAVMLPKGGILELINRTMDANSHHPPAGQADQVMRALREYSYLTHPVPPDATKSESEFGSMKLKDISTAQIAVLKQLGASLPPTQLMELNQEFDNFTVKYFGGSALRPDSTRIATAPGFTKVLYSV